MRRIDAAKWAMVQAVLTDPSWKNASVNRLAVAAGCSEGVVRFVAAGLGVELPEERHYFRKGRLQVMRTGAIGKKSPRMQRLRWEREARRAGVDPDDLNQLAAEIRAADMAHVRAVKRLLGTARATAQRMGLGRLDRRALDRAGDYRGFAGFDTLADEVARQHPDLFFGHEPTERLWALLMDGTPQLQRVEDNHRAALDRLYMRSAELARYAS